MFRYVRSHFIIGADHANSETCTTVVEQDPLETNHN